MNRLSFLDKEVAKAFLRARMIARSTKHKPTRRSRLVDVECAVSDYMDHWGAYQNRMRELFLRDCGGEFGDDY